MNVNQKSVQTPARDATGVMLDGTTSSESPVKVPSACSDLASRPLPCSPTLGAWLATQMSDAQFLEFRVAYWKWVEEKRAVRSRDDFRVELTPRPPMDLCSQPSAMAQKGGTRYPDLTVPDAMSAS